MNIIRNFFLARATIQSSICAALAIVTVSALIPQSFVAPAGELEKWRAAYQVGASMADLLGLHHILTTPGFAIVLLLIIISLGLSCFKQVTAAWQKTFHPVPTNAAVGEICTPLAVVAVEQILRRHGFRAVATQGTTHFLVRHLWGYWGNLLFHLGMVVTIAASMLIALTQQRGMAHLAVGASLVPGQAWKSAENGLLVHELRLPETVQLTRVNYHFGPDSGLQELSSQLTFGGADGARTTLTTGINAILQYRDLQIYQGTDFGHAFLLEVTGPQGRTESMPIAISHPIKPDKPSYQDYPDLLGEGYQLRAKYVANEGMKAFEPVNPVLTLRIDRQGKEVGRVALKPGSEGHIGPYRFRLLECVPWTQLIFVRLTGIPGVFFGFFIICLGAVLHYFTPPREVTLVPLVEGGTKVAWRSVRFADFYAEEINEIGGILHMESLHG